MTEWWGVGVAVVAPFLLPNSVVEASCFAAGKALTLILRQRVGRDATKRISGHLTGTVDSAMTGLTRGLRYEDE
jgi:hypothetical protein